MFGSTFSICAIIAGKCITSNLRLVIGYLTMQICFLVVIGMTGKEMLKMEGDLVAKKHKKHKKRNKKNANKALCVCWIILRTSASTLSRIYKARLILKNPPILQIHVITLLAPFHQIPSLASPNGIRIENRISFRWSFPLGSHFDYHGTTERTLLPTNQTEPNWSNLQLFYLVIDQFQKSVCWMVICLD